MLKSEPATEENIDKTGLYHRVHLPEARANEALPGVFIVHGRSGDATLMWVFSKVLQGLGVRVIAPQAPIPDPNGAYSWWLIDESPARARRGEIETSLDQFELFVKKSIESYNLNPKKLYAFGFSQGAALLGMLSLKNPELFKGVGLLSSFIPEFAFEKDFVSAQTKDLPSYFIFHGTEDKIIPFSMGEKTRDQILSLGAKLEFHSDSVAHKVSSQGIRALENWIKGLV